MSCIDDSNSGNEADDTDTVWSKREAARLRQINIGKARPEYRRYITVVPPECRDPSQPSTPDPRARISKRQFDRALGEWRRRLHDFDPSASLHPYTGMQHGNASQWSAAGPARICASDQHDTRVDDLKLRSGASLPVCSESSVQHRGHQQQQEQQQQHQQQQQQEQQQQHQQQQQQQQPSNIVRLAEWFDEPLQPQLMCPWGWTPPAMSGQQDGDGGNGCPQHFSEMFLHGVPSYSEFGTPPQRPPPCRRSTEERHPLDDFTPPKPLPSYNHRHHYFGLFAQDEAASIQQAQHQEFGSFQCRNLTPTDNCTLPTAGGELSRPQTPPRKQASGVSTPLGFATPQPASLDWVAETPSPERLYEYMRYKLPVSSQEHQFFQPFFPGCGSLTDTGRQFMRNE